MLSRRYGCRSTTPDISIKSRPKPVGYGDSVLQHSSPSLLSSPSYCLPTSSMMERRSNFSTHTAIGATRSLSPVLPRVRIFRTRLFESVLILIDCSRAISVVNHRVPTAMIVHVSSVRGTVPAHQGPCEHPRSRHDLAGLVRHQTRASGYPSDTVRPVFPAPSGAA